MKTFLSTIVIGLVTWTSLIVFERAGRWPGLDYWGYSETFLTVMPVLLAFATISIYFILKKSITNYREESRIPIGLTFIVALVIASVTSIFTFMFNAKHFTYEYGVGPYEPDQYDWTIMVLSGLLGLAVLFFFYWRTTRAIEKDKEEIDQRKMDEEARLLETEIESPKEQYDPYEVIDFLSHTPDYTRSQLLLEFQPIPKEELEKIVYKVFHEFLRVREYEKAELLAKFHQIDPHNLLYVKRRLDEYELTKSLKLEPNTFKIILDRNETAYEKLPCNWQKIHTYLAPLTDEHEQADILDAGNIYITDQRVFFVGKKGSETVYLNDIAYMDLKEDAIQFFRDEGLSEIFAFPTPHHAVYAELVIKALMAPSSGSG